jgi:hypothetical protein
MSDKETDDTNDSAGPPDEPSSEQAEDDGLLSNITGYFSDDDDAASDDAGPGPGSQPSDGPDAAPFGDDATGDESDDVPETEPFGADPSGSSDPIEEMADEAPAEDADETFSDLLGPEGEDERGQASEPDQPAAESDEPAGDEPWTDDPMTEEMPDPREGSPADVDPVADEDDDMLETDEEADPFEEMEGAFEEMDVEDVQPDEVWTDVADAEQRSVSAGTERTYAEVAKSEFCENCEYFSSPPDAHCEHEGTEIIEFTDMQHVRVVDCPIVAERRGLEEGMHSAFSSSSDDSEALGMQEAGELEE